jgi:hypothetical protein
MRSGWDAAAQWSFFDAGPFGLAHQHYDKLHLSVDAFGRALLVDAGRFDYAASAFRDYFVSSSAHNVLLVDGAGQNRTEERAASPLPGADYGSMLDFDYARGVFDDGYDKVLGRAVHTRTVVYLRGKYWVVADRLETDRARRVDALWHFAPECHVVLEQRSAVSTDDGQGNLRIVPVGGMPWRVALQTAPPTRSGFPIPPRCIPPTFPAPPPSRGCSCPRAARCRRWTRAWSRVARTASKCAWKSTGTSTSSPFP